MGFPMKKKTLAICLALLMLLAAVCMMAYPFISVWYNEKHQAELHLQFQDQIKDIEDTRIAEAKVNAVSYNEMLIPGVQMVENFSQEALLLANESYEDQLNIAGNGIMGYVEIPSIQVNLPIYHGTANATLEVGAGHLLGSSLPVGGESTHTILTAHSGMASKKMFSDLPLLEIGDVFYLDVLGERLAYQVDQIKTVLPYDTSYLGITEGEDYCTLVTCTPFGVNTHRLLVRGTRVPYEEAEVIAEEQAESEETTVSTWEQGYLKGIVIGLCIVAIAGLIVLAVCVYRRCCREDH